MIKKDEQEDMDSQDQNHDESPPLPPNNPTRIKKSMRGVNFSPEEDKLLVSAWLNCGIDAVQGTDQNHARLWEKISEYFQQHKETATERSIKSLTNRWSCIQKATNKFCETLAQVEELYQSGKTDQDKFEKASIMYESQEKCRFQFGHCWRLLKDQPKWISRDVKQRRTMFSSPTPTLNPTPIQCSGPIDDSTFDLETGNVIENEVVELDRPMCTKAEEGEETIPLKKMKYTHLEESVAQEEEFHGLKDEKMEYDKEKEEKKLNLEEERLRLEGEKIRQEDERLRLEVEKIRQEDERLRIEGEKMELAKKESDQRIMMMDVTVMPEMQRLYFEGLRREIMMRRRCS